MREDDTVAETEWLEFRRQGAKMRAILGLTGAPVGVRFLVDGARPKEARGLKGYRYCQALMLARRGEPVVLDEEGIACPAAAAAFGFRPLPDGLRSGQGLVGFGIVADEQVGRRMFEAMPRLEPGRIRSLHLFPLDRAVDVPDVVVVEDEVERLMWISLACLHATGGERVESSTAVLQATCVDSTIIPYLENRLNQGYGCYGCRDATDLRANETALGFPATLLAPITDHLEYLAQKAIPTSRSKKAWHGLQTGSPHHAEAE